MPRVSEAHLERRRLQIMDAARACFVRKGINETSMQDIFAESGLSAGAVYRYFKSKNELIEAIIATMVGDLHTFMADMALRDPLPPLDEMVEQLALKIIDMSGEFGLVRLTPQAWGMAVYDPEIARHVRENVGGLRETWIGYVRRLIEVGVLPPETDAVAVGKTLIGLLPGFILQRLLFDDVTPGDLRHGIRALSRDAMLSVTT